jgi:hypothetical protein
MCMSGLRDTNIEKKKKERRIDREMERLIRKEKWREGGIEPEIE